MFNLLFVACLLSTVSGLLAEDSTWIRSLKEDGYFVQEGKWGYFDTNTCAKADTCYAINPVTPYGLMYLPAHPNETSAGNYSNSCHLHGLCMKVGDAYFNPGWRIAPGEAIVLIGRTPPESTYWSFAPSLYTRFYNPGYKPNPKDLAQRIVACPSFSQASKGGRCEVFSAVNDPLNFQTVKVDAPSPFNAFFTMILSWDAEVESEVSQRLQDAGAGPVNYLRYPGAISKLGVTNGDEDEFITVMRVEDIARRAESEAFYGGTPYRVFRISRPLDNPPAASTLYASFDGRMRTRWTGRTESAPNATTQQLRDGLQQLSDLVVKSNAHFDDYTKQDFQSFVNDSGYECLARGLRCQGDCRDTIYAKATLLVEETLCNRTHLPCKPSRRAELTSKDSDAFFVVGVNHKLTQQSLYSSITAYNYPKLAAGILLKPNGHSQYTMMDADFKGSASSLLPDHPAAPYLYVVKYARKCSIKESFLCVQVPVFSQNPNVTAIAEDQPFVFIERMYIHPGTKSGPAVAETIFPVLLHFRRRFEEDAVVV